MTSTSPQIDSPCQCARCQKVVRVQGHAKASNFPGQFYLHVCTYNLYFAPLLTTSIQCMNCHWHYVFPVAISPRNTAFPEVQVWACHSQMKRMLVLAIWVNCVAEVLMDPVEIGVAVPVASSMVAVTCGITRRHNCQRTDDRSLTILTAITPSLPSLHLIPNVLHYSCMQTPHQ